MVIICNSNYLLLRIGLSYKMINLIILKISFLEGLTLVFVGLIVILIIYATVSDKLNANAKELAIVNRKALRKATLTKARKEVYINTIENQNEAHFIYLQSLEWKETKRLILLKRGYYCENIDCKKHVTNLFNLHLHHLTYEDLFNEYEEDLMLLCRECHEDEHGIIPKITIELQIEVLLLKKILNNLIEAIPLYHYKDKDIDDLEKWAKKHQQLLQKHNHPFHSIYKLLEEIICRERIIFYSDLKELYVLCEKTNSINQIESDF